MTHLSLTVSPRLGSCAPSPLNVLGLSGYGLTIDEKPDGDDDEAVEDLGREEMGREAEVDDEGLDPDGPGVVEGEFVVDAAVAESGVTGRTEHEVSTPSRPSNASKAIEALQRDASE